MNPRLLSSGLVVPLLVVDLIVEQLCPMSCYTPFTLRPRLSLGFPLHCHITKWSASNSYGCIRTETYRAYQLLITYISTVMAGHMDRHQPAAKPVMMSGFARGPGDLQFLMPNECDSSPFDYQSILMKDHFMGTAVFLGNTDFIYFSI